ESGQSSFEAWMAGDRARAQALVDESRQDDVPLYASLKERNVDFVRCRPVRKPLSSYLQWELQCYHFNAQHGERILFLDDAVFQRAFAADIQHDFMVFD